MTEPQNIPKNIPEGHMRNAMGHLVPIELVKPIDQERDRLVRELVGAARKVSETLGLLKGRIFGGIAAFVELSAEQYGATVGGRKGNVTLRSYDGQYKVEIKSAEFIQFDERLVAAKSLLDECAAEWAESSDKPEVKVMIQEVFREDKDGNLSVGRVLGLRRWNITDPRWIEAMKAISDSVQVVGSKQYVRVYERVGQTDTYQPISLDIASV